MTRTLRLALMGATRPRRRPGRIARRSLAAAPMLHAQPAAQGQAAFERAADALERVTWRTRTLVGDERLTQWKLAVRPEGLGLLDAVVRADALIVNFVEGTARPAGRADDAQAARRAALGRRDRRASAPRWARSAC